MKTVYGKIHSQNVSRIPFPNKESLSCMLKKDTSVFLLKWLSLSRGKTRQITDKISTNSLMFEDLWFLIFPAIV